MAISMAVNYALFPSIMKELEKDYTTKIRKLKKFDLLFWAALLAGAVFTFLFSDTIIRIFSNNNYSQSAVVLPFLVLGYIMGGMYLAVSQVLTFHNVVWFQPILPVVSFGISAILSWLLIPDFHELGAAYAFFLGNLLYSMIYHIIGKKYYHKLYFILIAYLSILIIVTLIFFKYAMII
jgi:O-antigen/teichoic acid export membrane protein